MSPLTDPLELLLGWVGLPTPLPPEPMTLLASWFDEARAAAAAPNPDAFLLATCTPVGVPSARVVLCKSIEAEQAAVVFFTNYTSRKGIEIESNPRVAGLFHWDHAGRQARVEGAVARVSAAESDAYFRTRPLLSRLGAWASEQGRPLVRRWDLVEQVRGVMKRFGVGLHHLALPSTAPEIPRPAHWGGYRLHIDAVELWMGGSGRLHDRASWRRPSIDSADWHATRLQP